MPKIDSTLLCTSKCVDAGYIQIYDKDDVNIYDAKTVTIMVSDEAVNQHFPDYKETQVGHMRNHCQNVRSTKKTRFELSPTIKHEAEIDNIRVETIEEDEEVE